MADSTVSITSMAFGGSGFGRMADGKACFVPYTAPGDDAVIRIVKQKKSYVEGAVQRILHPGVGRVSPPCPLFTICGGCHWQHLGYPTQLAEKQRIFSDLLCHQKSAPTEVVCPIIPSPEPLGYRSRVQFKLYHTPRGLHIGFYRPGSHFVVNLSDGCPLADPVINRQLSQLRELFRNFPEPASIPQIDVTVGEDGAAILIIHYIGSSPARIASHLETWKDLLLPNGLYLQTGRKRSLQKIFGLEKLSYAVPAMLPEGRVLDLSFSRGGFSQVNYHQNRELIRLALQWLDLAGTEKVLDLFCGNGNFSLPLALHAAEVVGLEIFEASIDDARANCTANDIHNARFLCGDASNELKRLATAGEFFDIVLLDPPRAGASDIVAQLPALKPRAILYVSCDPATLARDAAILKRHGYGVVKSCPVDMFPQTYHIESVTLLHPE